MFIKEVISDYHCVYVRVFHKNLKDDNSPTTNAFSNTPKEGDNLSSDWCKYCSPNSSRALIAKQKSQTTGQYKNPYDFYIWKFNVLALHLLDVTQRVEHQPTYNEPEIDGEPNNRVHSIIIGAKPVNKAEFKRQVKRAGEWAIAPPEI